MSLALITRRFNTEVQALLDKEVTVIMTNGKKFTGTLIGYDSNSKNICLGNVKDENGESYTRMIVYSTSITVIFTKEHLIDLRKFAGILEKYFPKMVRYYEEGRVIVVMDRIRVSDKGVEGTGPMAERIKRLFDEFLKETIG